MEGKNISNVADRLTSSETKITNAEVLQTKKKNNKLSDTLKKDKLQVRGL